MNEKELLTLCYFAIAKLSDKIEQLDPAFYSNSDLIMYSEDLTKLINGEDTEESEQELFNNVKKYFDFNA